MRLQNHTRIRSKESLSGKKKERRTYFFGKYDCCIGLLHTAEEWTRTRPAPASTFRCKCRTVATSASLAVSSVIYLMTRTDSAGKADQSPVAALAEANSRSLRAPTSRAARRRRGGAPSSVSTFMRSAASTRMTQARLGVRTTISPSRHRDISGVWSRLFPLCHPLILRCTAASLLLFNRRRPGVETGSGRALREAVPRLFGA